MRIVRRIDRGLALFGCDMVGFVRALRGLLPFWREYREFFRQARKTDQGFPRGQLVPCLRDRFEQAGGVVGQYFYQDLIVAQKILANKPRKHVDVGSSISGFVAHVAVFRPVEVFDIRPLKVHTPNIQFRQLNILDDKSVPSNYCDSLSCLHALEHFGLGRYGDPLHYEGHLKGISVFHRILEPNGRLYLSVPIGPQRVEFNAHRVFSIPYLQRMFDKWFKIAGFSYVDDNDTTHLDVDLEHEDARQNFGCHFGCGIFELQKVT